jgi:hypothetical protein
VRRTRHRRRFHTDRIVRNRRARYRRETPDWELDRRPQRLPYGLLADRDPWDCGRPGCVCCHWAKCTEPRRARENRAWRRLADGAH